MAESFNYNAPQFYDFDNNVQDLNNTCDEYFEQEQASKDPLNYSDYSNDVTLIADQLNGVQLQQHNLRRSLSVGQLPTIQELNHQLRNGKVYIYKDANETVSTSLQSLHEAGPSNSRTDSKFINRLAQPKRHFTSDQNLDGCEYVPLAEALVRFQNGTPKRFRTKSNPTMERLKCTVPKSPKLKTSVRSRPVHVLSRQEQEELALKEARNSRFKAHPVNKRILQLPAFPCTSKIKAYTIPEPFKLTPVPTKKISESANKPPAFHARPVPRYIYESQQPVIKAPLKPQVANPKAVIKQNQPKLTITKLRPFSFDLRDQLSKGKREAVTETLIDTEKRAKQFCARPLPKSMLGAIKKQSTGSQNNLLQERTKSEESVNFVQFKAKPPTVLYKKPFEPQRPSRPLLETDQFELNTDLRVKKREDFEQLKKKKENMLALFREEHEIMNKQRQEEESLRARKATEFKAHEIKKYKDVKIEYSKKNTVPISPKFMSDRYKHNSDNKENTAQ